MKIDMNRMALRALVPVLGLAVLGLAVSSPAQAQGKAKKPKSDRSMSRASTDSSTTDDEKYVDPMPINYPFAAPGSLQLYHFRSYRGNTLVEGSTEDARAKNKMAMDKKMAMMGHKDMSMGDAMQMSYKDDPFMADPAPLNYPMAAPGSLDLYHYSSYTGDMISSGSAMDKRDKNKMAMDKKRAMMGHKDMSIEDAMKMSYRDDPFMADPAPLNYPMAAPGSLQLYHYSSYAGDMISTGSVTDKREDQQKMMDQQKMSRGGKMKKSK